MPVYHQKDRYFRAIQWFPGMDLPQETSNQIHFEPDLRPGPDGEPVEKSTGKYYVLTDLNQSKIYLKPGDYLIYESDNLTIYPLYQSVFERNFFQVDTVLPDIKPPIKDQPMGDISEFGDLPSLRKEIEIKATKKIADHIEKQTIGEHLTDLLDCGCYVLQGHPCPIHSKPKTTMAESLGSLNDIVSNLPLPLVHSDFTFTKKIIDLSKPPIKPPTNLTTKTMETTELLECGCAVTKGNRCPVHNQP